MHETEDTNQEPDDTTNLATEIKLPAKAKDELEILCKTRGIAMRDYVEGLVQAALATDARSRGREKMARAAALQEHARFDEVRECKYGCGFMSTSKSGLTQHENECQQQESRRALERAGEAPSASMGGDDSGAFGARCLPSCVTVPTG